MGYKQLTPKGWHDMQLIARKPFIELEALLDLPTQQADNAYREKNTRLNLIAQKEKVITFDIEID